MKTDNPDQVEYWNNAGAERFVREQVRMDRVLLPLHEVAIERAAALPGERVVDVGCGCGASALSLAERVGETGSVFGIDLSAAMLARAAERASGLSNVTFEQADAAVFSFDGEGDLVFSRFGCMFFGDPVQAFSNLRRAHKDGGRLCFMCWRGPEDNPWLRMPIQVAARFVEVPPPAAENEPGPMSLARPARVREVLHTAGYRQIALEACDAQCRLSTTGVAEAVDFVMSAGPIVRVTAEADDDTMSRIRAALHEELARHCEGQTVALGAGAWIVTARA